MKKRSTSSGIKKRRDGWLRLLGPAILLSLLLHHAVLTSVPVPELETRDVHEVEIAYYDHENEEEKETLGRDKIREKRLPEEEKKLRQKEEKKPDLDEKKKKELKKNFEIEDIRNRTFVDQQQKEDGEKPENAKYLAPHDMKVEKETRALETTLIEEAQDQADMGEEGRDDRTDKSEQEAQEEKKEIAFNKARRKWKKVIPQTGDVIDTEPDGELIPFPDKITGPAGKDGKTRELNLKMSQRLFENLYSTRMAQQARERKEKRRRMLARGKMGPKLAKIKASLENFIPEVQIGNQTALNAAAHPFARYITRIHRNIHRYWGDGALVTWSRNYGSDHPLNDFTKWVKLEFEIMENGHADDVKVIKSSGHTLFDVAAVETIYNASPFPPPPEILLSYNRRVYIHWRFDRNHRQCGVWNAEPYILKGPPDERME